MGAIDSLWDVNSVLLLARHNWPELSECSKNTAQEARQDYTPSPFNRRQTMAYDDVQFAAVLNDARRIAIVGLSRRIENPSNEVAVYLKSKGYHITPFNPMNPEILGTRSYPSVSDIPGGVDMVVVFRRSQDIPDVVRDVIEASPKYLWLQLGIRNDEAVVRLSAIGETRGIAVHQDICIEQTHQRLLEANILRH